MKRALFLIPVVLFIFFMPFSVAYAKDYSLKDKKVFPRMSCHLLHRVHLMAVEEVLEEAEEVQDKKIPLERPKGSVC